MAAEPLIADAQARTPDAPAIKRPTQAKERLPALDVLRGFALLGILVPNMFFFAWPMEASYDLSVIGATPANTLAHDITMVAFLGKFMLLFATLFGAGVVFFDKKTEGKKLSAGAGLWYRRMGWMLLFGVCHALLLWFGDILVWYSVAGLALVWWIRRMNPVALIALGVMMHLLGTMLLFFFMVFGIWGVEQGAMAAGDLLGTPAAEEIAITLGDYPGLVLFRGVQLAFFWFVVGPLFYVAVTGLMAIGIGLTRLGILTGEKSARFYTVAALVLIPIGLTTTLLGLAWTRDLGPDPFPEMLWQCYAQFLGIPLGYGYAAVLLVILKLGLLKPVTTALAAVGRMAFSNYISQTLICTTIFYGYGLGYFAQIEFPALWGIIAGVWAFNIVFSLLWLRYFRFGPLEWLWRTLTYWKPQPILRTPAPPTGPAGTSPQPVHSA